MADIVGAVSSCISAAISVVQTFNQIRDGSRIDMNILSLNIDKVWQEVTALQTNEMKDPGWGNKDILLRLTTFCYDAEDLLQKIRQDSKDTMVVKLIWRLTKDKDQMVNNLKNSLDLSEPNKKTGKACHQTNTKPGPGEPGTLFGRDDDVNKITDQIITPAKLGNNGISIVGVLGVGKTSLAQKIYNEYGSEFCQSWVHLPDGKFDLENVKVETKHFGSNGNVTKKKMIVLDNLENVTDGQWLDFKNSMEKDIRIIITTRNHRIPALTDTTLYKLETLKDETFGEIIKAKLNPRQYWSDPQCQSAVKLVQQKWEGLPMIAALCGAIIGRYMRELNSQAEMPSPPPPDFQKQIVSKFASSINTDSTPGFWRVVGYLSLFPPQHQLDIEDFVHLLIGECFIPFEPPSSLKACIRDVVNDLKQKSIIFQLPENTLYKLNGLGSHVVSEASSPTYLRLDHQDHRLSSKELQKNPPRHLSILNKAQEFDKILLDDVKKLRKLRTFLSLHGKDNIGLLKKILLKLRKAVKRVRVLSLKGTDVDELPGFIDQLKHLQYLDISFTMVKELPKDICSLYALKILKLKGIDSCLPKDFHKLTNLLYVDWDEALLRKSSIREIGNLQRLENLPLFKVGTKQGYLISELKQMNNLQGRLHIQDLDEHVKSTDAIEANLQNKHGLTTIILEWKENSSHLADHHHDSTLEALRFRKDLEQFQLKNYGGRMLPEWITETFLQKIQLFNCRHCSFFPILGKLQLLKILVLENMDSITELSCRSDETHPDIEQFPALETMELYNMPNLQSFSGMRQSDMTKLEKVKIENCGGLINWNEIFHTNEERRHIRRIEIDGIISAIPAISDAVLSHLRHRSQPSPTPFVQPSPTPFSAISNTCLLEVAEDGNDGT